MRFLIKAKIVKTEKIIEMLYYITPEITLLHWLNVYGWRYIVSYSENLSVKQYELKL